MYRNVLAQTCSPSHWSAGTASGTHQPAFFQSYHCGCTLLCYPTFAMAPKAMPIPQNTVTFGSWAGHGHRFFELAGRKRKKNISTALQGIGSTRYEEAAPFGTRHEAATTAPATAMQAQTRATTNFEAITRATAPERKKVTGALLQGIACASNEATHQCTNHETEAKRLRQQFWENITPRWKERKEKAKKAGKKSPSREEHVTWCDERAKMQGVPAIWTDWT